MPKGKKNRAFREISNILDHDYGFTTEEQLEIAERLVNALRLVIHYEKLDAEEEACERRAKFKVV